MHMFNFFSVKFPLFPIELFTCFQFTLHTANLFSLFFSYSARLPSIDLYICLRERETKNYTSTVQESKCSRDVVVIVDRKSVKMKTNKKLEREREREMWKKKRRHTK